MSRIVVTGSADGLGLAAAELLASQGHQVVGHARSPQRADDLRRRVPALEAVVVGDAADLDAVRAMADELNALGHFDAVIHNVGVGYHERHRVDTPQGHAHVLAVNVLAAYVLTARMTRPDRLVYLSSGMHYDGDTSLDDIDWLRRPWDGLQAYADSKLFDVTLALAVARRWPEVLSNAVEPGWVPTRMGGAGAPDDLTQGHVTQAWLATSHDGADHMTGGYLYHLRRKEPRPEAASADFEDRLLAVLEALTGEAI